MKIISSRSADHHHKAHDIRQIGIVVASMILLLSLSAGCDIVVDIPTPTAHVAPTTIPISDSWWQVYFTEPDTINSSENPVGSIMEKLIERINQAENSIHIASFEFDLKPVAEALIAAEQRAVEVLWITDDENGIEADAMESRLFPLMKKGGVEIKGDNRSALMHNKFWIFDGKTVWTGATNITENGIFKNNNNVIVIESQALARIFEREFAEMWDGHFGPTSPSTVSSQSVTIEETPIQVLFASEDEVMQQLIPIIEEAQQNIRFMAFSFTDDELGNAIVERAQSGVDVKGIFETRGSETESSEMERLYCAKVPVLQDGNPSTFHHKVFVIDDEIVITGSLNFSKNADESNDENVVILANPEIAAAFLNEFETRWQEAKEPPAGTFDCR